MEIIIVSGALCFLMFVAYRGHSVILFAPVAALGAVFLTDPTLVAPMFSHLFMDGMAGFVQKYFPVFLLGAIFGKVIELSGFSKSIAAAVIKIVGADRAMLAIVVVCAILTYGGVSLFVVVFGVYPIAAQICKKADIPKRLIPGTIALGAFSFTMDALPGAVQIANIIPSTFFGTDTWAAQWLGVIGAVFILCCGLSYLEWRRRAAQSAGEGYGTGHANEPAPFEDEKLAHPVIALLPLVLVVVVNKLLTMGILDLYGEKFSFESTVIGPKQMVVVEVSKFATIWAVEGALLVGILSVFLFAWKRVSTRFAAGSVAAIGGSLLACLNTASEYGFGAVIAGMDGFKVVANALSTIPNPLINEAITITSLAGITGSASGGLSIALAAMAETFKANAEAAGIPFEVLHRIAAMAAGGMDTLPHNGAVITLLFVTGLTHQQSYRDIFAITVIKTVAVFVVIAVYYMTGIV